MRKWHSSLVWVVVVAFGLNAVFPDLKFTTDLAIGVPVGVVVGFFFGQLMAFVLTPKSVRDEERKPQSR